MKLSDAPFAILCAPPFLLARFDQPQRTLGWSLLRPGFAVAREVLWLHVRESDLSADVDPAAFLRARLAETAAPDALAMMTARDVRRHHFARRHVENIAAAALVTVGLSNGERVGLRRKAPVGSGTINILAYVSQPLTDGALVEAISIVTEARTAALLDARAGSGRAGVTGTGTDCIIVACPMGGAIAEAGLHTAVGEALGGAVYEAVSEGVLAWDREQANR